MRRFILPRKAVHTAAGFLAVILGLSWAGAEMNESLIKYSSISWNKDRAIARDQEGRTVELGLEHKYQKRLKHILTRAKPIAGAATMVDVQTGQILAAAEVGNEPRGSLLFDPIAPAASVFKLVTTVALFEKTDVTPLTRVCTSGGLRGIEREHLSPATGPDAICTKFAYALGVSRNAVYAQLATQRLMRTDLEEVARGLGFSSPLAIDVPARMGSLEVPYNDLAFARTAAGFENSRLSAMGAAKLALTIARGGESIPLHFSKTSSNDQPTRVMSQRTARRLRDAMEVTIHSGTARSSFVNAYGKSTVGPVQVAGKTGTLQEKPGGPTTSWFVGFAPSENPSVVVSVVLQNPMKWHQRGHEVGRDLLRAYLSSLGVSLPKQK